MLRSMNDLKGYQIQATDGTIGHVKDFYFDDEWWTVRYLVVETGNWFNNRKVLISPFAIGVVNWRVGKWGPICSCPALVTSGVHRWPCRWC